MFNVPNINNIWSIKDEHNFNDYALQIFHYQRKTNKVYSEYIHLIGCKTELVTHYSEIPFLPISFFKTHRVVSGDFKEEAIFESSSTSNQGLSKHFVPSVEVYHTNCETIFKQTFGSLKDVMVLGLLPNYLERQNSSLVSMVSHFMGKDKEKNFYLYNHEALAARLNTDGRKVLFGVSFALLDFCEQHSYDGNDLTIIETGGMKGRKKEITKQELYTQLRASFPNATIYSEYGMTELMSQAYSNQEGIYRCPSWMKVQVRLDSDPLDHSSQTRGGINIIDLANIHSCAFIATDDIGKMYDDGSFEVLGRLDSADIRGCSLMV